MDMRKLICLGDSLTFGLRVPHSQAWPRLVSRETGLEVQNLGISGDTTGGMLARLQNLVGTVSHSGTAESMPVLLIMGGSNDIFYAGTDTGACACKACCQTCAQKAYCKAGILKQKFHLNFLLFYSSTVL